MVYEIGLSSQTIQALGELGTLGCDKVQQFFPYAIKQQLIYGYTSFTAMLISIAIVFIGIYLFPRTEKDELIGPCIVSGAILFVASTTYFLLSGVSCILNPEYNAVMDIISNLK